MGEAKQKSRVQELIAAIHKCIRLKEELREMKDREDAYIEKLWQDFRKSGVSCDLSKLGNARIPEQPMEAQQE